MNMIESWRCTSEADLGEPLLVLRTMDGQEMTFMLPAAAAEALGQALLTKGRESARVGPPN